MLSPTIPVDYGMIRCRFLFRITVICILITFGGLFLYNTLIKHLLVHVNTNKSSFISSPLILHGDTVIPFVSTKLHAHHLMSRRKLEDENLLAYKPKRKQKEKQRVYVPIGGIVKKSGRGFIHPRYIKLDKNNLIVCPMWSNLAPVLRHSLCDSKSCSHEAKWWSNLVPHFKNYHHILHLSHGLTKKKFKFEELFYPQSWWCHFDKHLNDYDIITLPDSHLKQSLNRSLDHIPINKRSSIIENIQHSSLLEENYKIEMKTKLKQLILSNKQLALILTQTYYSDYKMFNFQKIQKM